MGTLLAIIGNFFGGFSFISTIRERRRIKKSTASRAAQIMYEYANKILSLIEGERRDNYKNGINFNIPPAPPFPNDLDWKSIDHKLVNRIEYLPSARQHSNEIAAQINVAILGRSITQEHIDKRDFLFFRLAFKTAKLAQKLEKKYRVPVLQPVLEHISDDIVSTLKSEWSSLRKMCRNHKHIISEFDQKAFDKLLKDRSP